MSPSKELNLIWVKWICIVLACLLMFVGFVYAYDKPGGIADWRYSRAAGYPGTIHIPLGDTPEQAVLKFRQSDKLKVVHKEAVHGGVLLFVKQNEIKEGADLGIEYVIKTWMGWKWRYGGAYGLSTPTVQNEALNFMSLPKYKGIDGPLPIMFGQLTDSSITSVKVTVSGQEAGSYSATIIEYGPEQHRLWYVVLPVSSNKPYKLEAFNDNEEVLASKTFDNPTDFGSILMFNKE
jgi:hypothetical protein